MRATTFSIIIILASLVMMKAGSGQQCDSRTGEPLGSSGDKKIKGPSTPAAPAPSPSTHLPQVTADPITQIYATKDPAPTAPTYTPSSNNGAVAAGSGSVALCVSILNDPGVGATGGVNIGFTAVSAGALISTWREPGQSDTPSSDYDMFGPGNYVWPDVAEMVVLPEGFATPPWDPSAYTGIRFYSYCGCNGGTSNPCPPHIITEEPILTAECPPDCTGGCGGFRLLTEEVCSCGCVDPAEVTAQWPGQAGSSLRMFPGPVQMRWVRINADKSIVEYERYSEEPKLRLLRRFKGSYDEPDWQYIYSYDEGGRLISITSPRGVDIIFEWVDKDSSAGEAWRVSCVKVNYPGAWSVDGLEKQTSFTYYDAAPYNLKEIIRPQRTFWFDDNRDGAYGQNEIYNSQPKTYFTYVSGSSMISGIWDHSISSNPRLVMSFDYCDPQLGEGLYYQVRLQHVGEVACQGIPPGQDQKTFQFGYSTDNTYKYTQAIDPLGRTWVYKSQRFIFDPDYESPFDWKTIEITRTVRGQGDPRPSGGNNYYQSLTWKYQLDSCGCAYTSIEYPSGLKESWTYTNDGRMLVTNHVVTGLDQSTKVRTYDWEPWGEYESDLGTYKDTASRLKSYTDPSSLTTNIYYTFPEGGITATVVIGSTTVSAITKDYFGRPVKIEGMAFSSESGTKTPTTAFSYGTASNVWDYLLLKKVAHQGSVDIENEFIYSKDGYVITHLDPLGRETAIENDVYGNPTKITRPTTLTGYDPGGQQPPTYNQEIIIGYNLEGGIAAVQRSGFKEDGNAYASTKLNQIIYDWFGRPWKIRENFGSLDGEEVYLTSEVEFDKSDRLIKVTGFRGEKAEYVFDDQDMLYQYLVYQDGAGTSKAASTFWFNQDGVPKIIINPAGIETRIDIDAHGVQSGSHVGADANERHISSSFDPAYRLTSLTYSKGIPGVSQTTLKTRTLTYDALKRVEKIEESAPGVGKDVELNLTWNGLGLISRVSNQDSRSANYYFDQYTRVSRVVDNLISAGVGNQVSYSYDLAGNAIEIKRLLKHHTGGSSYSDVEYMVRQTFDSWNRPIRVDDYGTTGNTILASSYSARDSYDHLTWAQDPVGKSTESSYDAQGRQLSHTINPRTGSQEDPITITMSYNDAPTSDLSTIVTKRDGGSSQSEYRYSIAGLLKQYSLPGTGNWVISHDSAGRISSSTDPNSTVVSYSYDSVFGRLEERSASSIPGYLSLMAVKETYAYDDFDNISQAKTWWQAFGLIEPAVLVNSLQSVDPFGRRTTECFGYLNAYFKYVNSGWLYNQGTSEDLSFRRSMTNASGFKMTYTPDAVGKVQSIGLDGTNGGAPGWVLTNFANYRYQGPTKIFNSIVPGSDPGDVLNNDFTLNTQGFLTNILSQYYDGQNYERQDLTITRDIIGNVINLQYDKASSRLGDFFKLDDFDRLKEAKLGVDRFDNYDNALFNDKITYNLDEAHNRTTVVHDPPAGGATTAYDVDDNRYVAVDDVEYLYDSNGNLICDQQFVYLYDFLNRLSEIKRIVWPEEGKFSTARKISFDDYVKIVKSDRTSKGTGAKEKIETVSYPALVNSTGAKSTALSEEVTLEDVAWYGYDTRLHRRILKLLPSEVTWYAWDEWQCSDEFDMYFASKKVHFDGISIDEHLAFGVKDAQGAWERYTNVQNHLGNVMMVLDSAGDIVEQYEYDPYGSRVTVYKRQGSNCRNEYGFTGRQHDSESGLIYFRYRYYSPILGRFLTNDPIGIWKDGGNWGNGYVYVGGSPCGYMDAWGLRTFVINLGYKNKPPFEIQNDMRFGQNRVKKDPEGGKVFTIEKDDLTDAKPKLGDGETINPKSSPPSNPNLNDEVVVNFHGDVGGWVGAGFGREPDDWPGRLMNQRFLREGLADIIIQAVLEIISANGGNVAGDGAVSREGNDCTKKSKKKKLVIHLTGCHFFSPNSASNAGALEKLIDVTLYDELNRRLKRMGLGIEISVVGYMCDVVVATNGYIIPIDPNKRVEYGIGN